ncbi:MAG: hypothetical protein AAB800_04575 [Patescibacteria group bacterium]
MVAINRTGDYEKMLEDLADEDEEMLERVRARVKIFRKNPKDTRIDNHPLHKRMEERWAFSVNDDIRIVYEWVGKTTVRLLAIGTHEAVYKKSS